MQKVKGNDHFHSMNKEDLIKFRENIDLILKINKKTTKRKVLNCEKIKT